MCDEAARASHALPSGFTALGRPGHTFGVGIPNHYPEGVKATPRALTASVSALGGVRDLVVYGSLARGNLREGESDINLAIVLDDAAGLDVLGSLAGPPRAVGGPRSIDPFIVKVSELSPLADVFPIKLFDTLAT